MLPTSRPQRSSRNSLFETKSLLDCRCSPCRNSSKYVVHFLDPSTQPTVPLGGKIYPGVSKSRWPSGACPCRLYRAWKYSRSTSPSAISILLVLRQSSDKYALTAVQNLMDLEYGWSTLNDEFIYKIVQILASPHSPINVCRPATAILKKLVEADPMNAPGPVLASSSRSPPQMPPDSVYKFGFQCVFEQMQRGKGSLETVINRLGSADTAMALNR